MIFQSDKSFRATVCVAEEEKQPLSVRDPIREREAYCSTQREKEGELLISFLMVFLSLTFVAIS